LSPPSNNVLTSRYSIPNQQILQDVCGSWIFYLTEIWYNYRIVWHKWKYKTLCLITQWFLRDCSHCFPYLQYKFQLVPWIPGWFMLHYTGVHMVTFHSINIKFTSIASVSIIFPCHICECPIILSSDHLFLCFSWNSLVSLFCLSHRLYWVLTRGRQFLVIPGTWTTTGPIVCIANDCVAFSMLSISTWQISSIYGQSKDGDGTTRRTNLARQSLLSSLLSITAIHHFPP
jgi:hypothetical protein